MSTQQSPAEMRSVAMDMARQAACSAARYADSIPLPLYRCQAQAAVARYADGRHVLAHANKAMATAATCQDDYQRARAAQWPIRALLERGFHREAMHHLEQARSQASRAQPNASRSYALVGLLQAAWQLGNETRRSIVRELAELAALDTYWRVHTCLRNAVDMMRADDPAFVREVIGGVTTTKTRRRLEKDDAAGVNYAPRDYF